MKGRRERKKAVGTIPVLASLARLALVVEARAEVLAEAAVDSIGSVADDNLRTSGSQI